MKNSTPQQKIGFLPWLVWSCGGLFYCYQFILRSSPGSMTEELMETFQVQGLALGALIAFYYYAYSSFQIPIGMILDRLGVRRVFIVSCSMCVLGCLVFASSPNLTIACLGRFMIGMGSAGAWIGTLKLATLWFPADRVATVIGATMFLGTVGPFVCGPLVANMVDSLGWRSTVYFLSGIGLLLLTLIIYLVRDPSKTPIASVPSASTHALDLPLPFVHNLRLILKSKSLWLNAIYGMLMYVPLAAFCELWGVRFLQDTYGLSKTLATSVIFSAFFGTCIGALSISYFSDLVNSRRLLMKVGAGACLLFYSFLVYVPALPLELLYALTFLSGFFFCGQLMCFANAVVGIPPQSSGLALGFTNMIVMLSGVIFEPFVGWLLDKSRHAVTGSEDKLISYTLQDWRFALSSVILCLILAFILSFFIQETHPKAGILHRHGSV